MRTLKRPDGAVVEEYVTSSFHVFEDGEFVYHDNNPADGDYTGRFCFRHASGKFTPWYTDKTAPKWLLAMWEDAIVELER